MYVFKHGSSDFADCKGVSTSTPLTKSATDYMDVILSQFRTSTRLTKSGTDYMDVILLQF